MKLNCFRKKGKEIRGDGEQNSDGKLGNGLAKYGFGKTSEDEAAERAAKARRVLKPKLTLKQILKQRFKENILLLITIAGVISGIVIGLIVRANTNFKPPVKNYFNIPGELFLRMLKFLILPLVSSSLICGISGLGATKLKKIALRSILFYFLSMLSAVVVGLVLSATIKPGLINRSNVETITTSNPLNRKVSTADTVFDLLRNLLPENMVQMCFNLYETLTDPVFLVKYNMTLVNESNYTIDTIPANETKLFKYVSKEIDYYETKGNYRQGLNVLGLVVFCIVFGIVVGQMNNDNSRVLIQFFEAVNEASIRIIRLVIWLSPLGVGSLVCAEVIKMEKPEETFRSISYYIMTVLIGLFIQGVIVLPAMYMIVTRKNVLKFFKDMSEALLIALATSSSAATLPITFRCIEVKHRVPKLISRFVLPVGAIVNLDGTALYEAAGAIFIAQMTNIELTFADYIITSITATLAAIGASGIPSAGLVTMVIVLSALNIPQDRVSLIYAVDWFLDRFRTMINVWGDSVATAAVAHLSRHEVKPDEDIDLDEYDNLDVHKAHKIDDNAHQIDYLSKEKTQSSPNNTTAKDDDIRF